MIWWKLQRLKSSNEQIRRRAVKGLSHSRDPRALAALILALKDQSYLVRKEAAQALGELGDARAVGPLIALIEDCFHYAMARTAVGALERVLVRVAASAGAPEMQAAAQLADVSGTYSERRAGVAWFSELRQVQHWTMDCSQIRKLAHRELTRRGLTV